MGLSERDICVFSKPGDCLRSAMTNDTFEIEEVGTDRYCSLEEAQRAALPPLAEILACMVRQGIEEGRFVLLDGVVRLAQRCKSEEIPDRGFANGKKGV